jgi:fatty-acyl-CoA synthase
MSAIEISPQAKDGSAAKAWLRALELTSPITRNRDRIFPAVIEELATRLGDSPALLSDRESLTYRGLIERANQYARWALNEGLAKGDVVCLLMPNRPEYMAIWLGITSIGGVVALLNTNLVGRSLAHCVHIVAPKHLIVAAELIETFTTALPDLTGPATIWVHGAGHTSFPRIDLDVERNGSETLNEAERRPISIEDLALYIYTSGTTGLPKAANVSHARVMQWSHWFAGMIGVQPTDRMYNCLPMYHSVGGVLTPGAILAGGGAVVIRKNFSANQFWSDIVHWDCTLFQYIGELCRYLLHTGSSPNDTRHRIRMACGNGLRADVWEQFQNRFRISKIFEFYAATEGAVSLFNIEGKCGAIGRVPSYLGHRVSPTLVQFNVDKGELVRNEDGFCIRAAPNEVGEAISRVPSDSTNVSGRFEGYTSKEASEQKIFHHVFAPGDAWIRTGDLMRKDENGFFYFVDRIGDTFRWKGENVATSEVEEAICAFSRVKHANVYGVGIRGTDGRAGMAALVTENDFDLGAFREHMIRTLPRYARPLFLRIREGMDMTGTFKHSKRDLLRQGFDPAVVTDLLYFDDPSCDGFVPLDRSLYDRIESGEVRL